MRRFITVNHSQGLVGLIKVWGQKHHLLHTWTKWRTRVDTYESFMSDGKVPVHSQTRKCTVCSRQQRKVIDDFYS